jgi:uncharacterized coiled-coil protein SlyX
MALDWQSAVVGAAISAGTTALTSLVATLSKYVSDRKLKTHEFDLRQLEAESEQERKRKDAAAAKQEALSRLAEKLKLLTAKLKQSEELVNTASPLKRIHDLFSQNPMLLDVPENNDFFSKYCGHEFLNRLDRSQGPSRSSVDIHMLETLVSKAKLDSTNLRVPHLPDE